jgi:hypothetical protein
MRLLDLFDLRATALRARAAHDDAAFAVRQFDADRRLRTIRYQNAMADLERAVGFPPTADAPTLCDCLSQPGARP